MAVYFCCIVEIQGNGECWFEDWGRERNENGSKKRESVCEVLFVGWLVVTLCVFKQRSEL